VLQKEEGAIAWTAQPWDDSAYTEETMERRQFLAASIAASTLAIAGDAAAQAAAQATGEPASAIPAREFYQIRRYGLKSGPQLKLTESYFGDALIPALARQGMGPIGAFKLDIGPETPAYYLLIPGSTVQAHVELDLRLAQDASFMTIAEPFWNATGAAPAFERIESSLLAAFEGWPKLTPPAASGTKGKRIFQLRIYESPSNLDHVRKVEMFHSGEFELFKNAGFHPVFFGDTQIGPRLPNLHYMLSFANMAELEAQWEIFRNDPAWKKLSSNPRFSFDNIVDNITNLILSPLACSQI
jgi:hypothetical protein